MGVAEREHDRVLGRRRLQLEVELAAETLAQRQPPGAIETTAEGGVQHQLHAPGLIEESLQHQVLLRRHHAEGRLPGRQIVDDLLGRAVAETNLINQPPYRCLARALGVLCLSLPLLPLPLYGGGQGSG